MADTQQSTSASLELSLPSDVSKVDLVHEMLEEVARGAGFPEEEILDIALAVREAVVNAMVHGNASDASKKVLVRVTSQECGIEIQVRDSGGGFDPEQVPDPTKEENLLRTSGRGLKMMETLMDDVSFSFPEEGGTEVTMRKRCQATSRKKDGRETEA